METTISDFEFNEEESFFTHTPSDFRLDCDFVLLFSYSDVSRLFAVGSGNYILDEETINELRMIVSGARDKKATDAILASLPPEELKG
jgi:hypothetical protein